MKTRRLAALCAAALIASTGVIASRTVSADDHTVQLHNPSGGQFSSDCPPDGKPYWHFILAPNNDSAEFVSITLIVGDSPTTYTFLGDPPIVKNGNQTDNVFVPVLAGQSFAALQSGSAVIKFTEQGKAKESLADYKFNLSHKCPGDTIVVDDTEELTVTKTVNTSFDRTHNWSVEKNVDKSVVKLFADGSGDGNVTWTIDVKYGVPADSNHKVFGTVTITNTGDIAALVEDVDNDVIDTLTVGGVSQSVVLDCGDWDGILDVDDWVDCTYSVEVGIGKPTLSNKASVTTANGNYESAAVPGLWGDPANEANKTVNLKDDSTLKGVVDLGNFTAPTGGQKQYSHGFTWAQYGAKNCGTKKVDNTAKLFSGAALIGSDTASVSVGVQCVSNETAWAANCTTKLQLPYNENGKGNWATYVKMADSCGATPGKTTTIFAGQHHPVGTAQFEPTNGSVKITITLDGATWGGKENLKIESYSSAPSGNPAPGKFKHKTTCATSPCVLVVPNANFYGVHLDVLVADPNF